MQQVHLGVPEEGNVLQHADHFLNMPFPRIGNQQISEHDAAAVFLEAYEQDPA